MRRIIIPPEREVRRDHDRQRGKRDPAQPDVPSSGPDRSERPTIPTQDPDHGLRQDQRHKEPYGKRRPQVSGRTIQTGMIIIKNRRGRNPDPEQRRALRTDEPVRRDPPQAQNRKNRQRSDPDHKRRKQNPKRSHAPAAEPE